MVCLINTTLGPWAIGVCIRQTTHVHDITFKYDFTSVQGKCCVYAPPGYPVSSFVFMKPTYRV